MLPILSVSKHACELTCGKRASKITHNCVSRVRRKKGRALLGAAEGVTRAVR